MGGSDDASPHRAFLRSVRVGSALTGNATACIQLAMLGRLAALSLGLATLARAQTVSGRVTDRTSGMPVAGVVVSALDANGQPLVRAVTDSASGYRILLVPGALKLHFRRIGFSPAQAAVADTVNGRIDVVLSRLPTQLPPVKAVAAAQCEAEANSADALSLWEEARAGLITSLVARETRKTALISVLVYQTEFNGDDEEPRMVQRKEMADVSHAFRSEDPAVLARKGYFDGFAFISPDENVLADESFLSTHCFRMGESPDDSTIALHFSPAKGRKVVDLDGTLLLKRDPLDLRSIEYRYTGTPSAIERGRPGGSIHFRNMPNGITMVQEWRVRSAWQERGAVRGRAALTRRASRAAVAAPSRDPRLNVSETGALIELMQWPDGAPFVAPLATVSGVAIDNLTGKPLPNTTVRLHRTPYTAISDSTGAFTMIDVLPGKYEADVGDPRLELFNASGDLVGPFAVKYGTNAGWKLLVDGPFATAVRGCSEKADGRVDMPKPLAGNNVIFGLITTASGGLPPKGQQFFVDVTPAGTVPGTPAFPLKGKADEYGRFRICGLPAGSVQIRSSNRSGLATILDVAIDPGQPYHLLTLKLPIQTGR